MNIFILSTDPIEAAVLQCDKHVVKMILESTQMLSTVINLHGGNGPYKSTHINHPCTVWVGESKANFHWLLRHAIALCVEYFYRYRKVHKCLQLLLEMEIPATLPNSPQTPFVKAMPDFLKSIDDPVEAYRTYYRLVKKRFAKWTGRPVPSFMEVEDNERN